MNAESSPKGAPEDLGQEVKTDSTEGGGQASGAGPRFGICDPRAAAIDLSKAALRLYVAMTRYADGKTRVARPGQLRLIADLGWTYSGGKPDRRRLHRVLGELEDADLIRRDGTHPLGKGRWVHRYLIAPYPPDADGMSASGELQQPADAVTSSASPRGTVRDDADVSHRRCGRYVGTFKAVLFKPSLFREIGS